MTPDELRVTLDMLTGNVRQIAGELGISRDSIYKMRDGVFPVRPETAARLHEMLRRRADGIAKVLGPSGDPG